MDLNVRIGVVHEWLTEWGGSEDALRAMLRCLPGAELSATIDFLSEADRRRLGVSEIRTSFLQRAPWVRQRFWNYLPLTPLAVESHDLSDKDIVVSSSHAFAKGVLTTASQLHVSYVYSPMRYAWDLHHQYLRDYGLDRGIKGLLARWLFHRLRLWDRQTANNVDLFLADSRYVQQRIWRCYRRPSLVLYPPVRVADRQVQQHKGDTYVTVSRLVSYKRVDLIVDAFARMPQRKLVVIGDGPERGVLRRRCPPNVQLLGWQPDAVVDEHLGQAKAFIFAACEDFGISPLDAQACGTPVIAYGAGGALETVRGAPGVSDPTGLFFPAQTADSLMAAVEQFESEAMRFTPDACRRWALEFDEARFHERFTAIMARAWATWQVDPQGLERILVSPP